MPIERLLVNQLRMASKNFTEAVWSDWIERCRRRYPGKLTGHPEGLWARAWDLFGELRPSVEHERAYLLARRVHDEFWFAERFDLPWPRLQTDEAAPIPTAMREFSAASEPSPAPTDLPVENQAPTVENLQFEIMSLANAYASGTLTGTVIDPDASASGYTIELDLNDDEIPEHLGAAGASGSSFAMTLTSVDINNTVFRVRAVESTLTGILAGPWSMLNFPLPPNTPPRLAAC